MKVCVLESGRPDGNTRHAVELVRQAMLRQGEVEFINFYFPKDMPQPCCGCYRCFMESPTLCPHRKYVEPIEQAMREADGIIISTPVYVLAESAQIKTMLDHFGYLFMVHKPMGEMYRKNALVVSTTAGAGTHKAAVPIRRILRFWGVRHSSTYGLAMYSLDWKKMSQRKQIQAEKQIQRKAVAFYRRLSRKRQPPSLFTRMMYAIFSRTMKLYADGYSDKEYWKANGWLEGARPWK